MKATSEYLNRPLRDLATVLRERDRRNSLQCVLHGRTVHLNKGERTMGIIGSDGANFGPPDTSHDAFKGDGYLRNALEKPQVTGSDGANFGPLDEDGVTRKSPMEIQNKRSAQIRSAGRSYFIWGCAGLVFFLSVGVTEVLGVLGGLGCWLMACLALVNGMDPE